MHHDYILKNTSTYITFIAVNLFKLDENDLRIYNVHGSTVVAAVHEIME